MGKSLLSIKFDGELKLNQVMRQALGRTKRFTLALTKHLASVARKYDGTPTTSLFK